MQVDLKYFPITLTALSFMFVFAAFSQDGEAYERKRVQYKDAFTKKGQEQWLLHETKDGNSAFVDSVLKVIYVDTFVVQHMQIEMQQWNNTTIGINQANMYTASDYEVLVQKYVDILDKKLALEDRIVFQEAQQAWQVFQEKERKLCGVLMKPEYSGGGSIQTIYYTERLIQIQKSRLEFLITYLTALI